MAESLFDIDMECDALISPCGKYRYSLYRRWDYSLPTLRWIMVNPSTADHKQDDPTIKKCIAFAKSWEYGGILVVNLFALRATNPREIYKAADPVGPENDEMLKRILLHNAIPDMTIAAWGCNGQHLGRDRQVVDMLNMYGKTLHCLGTTQDGHPKHPLYLAASTKPVPFTMKGK